MILVTYSRATLDYVSSSTTNVTLSLPDALLRRFRIYAASQNRSMSSLLAESIQAMVERESGAAEASKRLIERMRNAPDTGLRGRIPWTRDEMHER